MLASESRGDFQKQVNSWEDRLQKYGLRLSISKTEYMECGPRMENGSIRVDGTELKKVNGSKYLQVPENGLTLNDPRDFNVIPIISGIGGPTDRISWLLNMSICVYQYVPAHLSSSSNFLKHLRSTSFQREWVVETFDVTSPYTNVSNDVAMQAVHELLTQRQASLNMYGLSNRQIMTLINECLNCSIFRWSEQH
ncbi:hypothetical protein RB195_014849 [Necator americanus]|uniref:Reverse transcriptase domain-containing protein n=1 Tax=Necator americanus TaxID=51031 RepID=A0ABR1E2D2_NECAM